MRPLLLLPLVAAANANTTHYPSVVTTTPPPTNARFDYVVVGGGTTGLTVSARLAEDPGVRVLTIEAGWDNRTAADVQSIFNFPLVLGGPLDWALFALLGAITVLHLAAVADARQRGLQVVPTCSYAAAWLRRHPQD